MTMMCWGNKFGDKFIVEARFKGDEDWFRVHSFDNHDDCVRCIAFEKEHDQTKREKFGWGMNKEYRIVEMR